MKTTFQETLATPKGFRIYTPQVPATYLQTKVVELHWQGFTAGDISFLHNVDTDFVYQAIAEYSR